MNADHSFPPSFPISTCIKSYFTCVGRRAEKHNISKWPREHQPNVSYCKFQAQWHSPSLPCRRDDCYFKPNSQIMHGASSTSLPQNSSFAMMGPKQQKSPPSPAFGPPPSDAHSEPPQLPHLRGRRSLDWITAHRTRVSCKGG